MKYSDEYIRQEISCIFDTIEIQEEYSTEVIKIKKYEWNGDSQNFKIKFYLKNKEYLFHCNKEICEAVGVNWDSLDILKQLEWEINYLKRVYERGIGAKDYILFTNSL
jgi:hypothetical protein